MKFIFNKYRLLHRMGWFPVVLVLFCLVPMASRAQASGKQKLEHSADDIAASTLESGASPAGAAMPPGPEPIQLADVPAREAEAANLLRSLVDDLKPGAQIGIIKESLPEAALEVDRSLEETSQILQRHLALPTLQAEQQKWRQIRLSYDKWLDALKQRSDELQHGLNQLQNLQEVWTATLSHAQDFETPAPILLHITETIAAIQTAQVQLKEQLAQVLELQGQVSNIVLKCEQALAGVAREQQEAMSDILVRDSLPVWSTELWSGLQNTDEHARGVAAAFLEDIREYFTDPGRHMSLHVVIFVIMIIMFLAARVQVRRWTASDEDSSPVLRVFDHPLAAALTLALFIVTSPYFSSLPAMVRTSFQVLAIVPMIFLVRPFISIRLLPGLYVLGILLALDAVRETFLAEHAIGQVFLILEGLVGLLLMTWFLKNIRQALAEKQRSSRLRVYQLVSVPVFLFLAFGFVAAALGYARIAALITPGIIAAGVLALTLYASLRIFIGIVVFAFHAWPLRNLMIIRRHGNLLEKRILRLLILAAVAGLVVRYLEYIGLLESVTTLGRNVLNAEFERGAFSLSLGSIIEFFLVVLAAYLLSAFIRFVLQEDIYPRIKIAPGKSYAVSRLLHYFIIALGFTAAIAAMGIDLTKLTVLTGALGIGIGFGLQSVVNNFVSGLILMFERPIQVGDSIEVDGLICRVRRIGIRGSVIRTQSGADIIIPNSQLIAEKVTNWTHSDQMKRIDLPVGISYATDPKSVISLLVLAAYQNPDVLREPPPQGLLTGFGDSSINFELRAWTDQFDNWRRVKSELATAIFDAVQAAGMTIPFPQREVRLLKDNVKKDAAAESGQEMGPA